MDNKLKELGFVINKKTHAYQQHLSIPTYYNKDLNIYLMQYDAVSHEDLRDKKMFCAIAIYKNAREKMWITEEVIGDIEYMKTELDHLYNRVQLYYTENIK